MRTRTEIALWSTVVATSLALHAVAFGGLGHGRSDGFGRKKQRPPALVEMSVAPPKEAPPRAKPAAKEPPRVTLSRPARTHTARPASPPPPSAVPPPAAETPADFTGVTMTNDGPGAGWSSATGNGQAMDGPVGRPDARVTHRDVDGDSAGAGREGPRTVALGNLSRPPAAPELSAELERLYPAEARRKGQTGSARMRVLVLASGHVGSTDVVSNTGDTFASACRQVLRGSVWTPGIDRQGNAVATYVPYTCRFNVQ